MEKSKTTWGRFPNFIQAMPQPWGAAPKFEQGANKIGALFNWNALMPQSQAKAGTSGGSAPPGISRQPYGAVVNTNGAPLSGHGGMRMGRRVPKVDPVADEIGRKNAVLTARFRTVSTFPLQGGPFHLNAADKPHEGVATFGMVREQGRRAHQGLDIQAPLGTPVVAVGSGKIAFSGWIKGYGYAITVDHGNGLYSFYAHLEQGSLAAAGADVKAGSQIGRVGKSGNAGDYASIDSHLHFELRTQSAPQRGLAGRIDPLPYVYPFHWSYGGEPDY